MSNCDKNFQMALTESAFDVIRHADGKSTVNEIIASRAMPGTAELFSELWDLWSDRVITLTPRCSGGAG